MILTNEIIPDRYKKYKWRKLNENELECTECPTAIIVNQEVIDDML